MLLLPPNTNLANQQGLPLGWQASADPEDCHAPGLVRSNRRTSILSRNA
jgi:hypothetical protein